MHVGSAVERINRSKLDQLICTDTITLPMEKQIDKMAVTSVACLLANAIRNVHEGESVAQLSP